MTKRSVGVVVLLVLIGLVGGLLATEIYARITLAGQPSWPDRWTFRASRPPPYRDASYFSPAFITESEQVVRLLPPPADDPEGRLIRLGDYTGHWFNVRDGHRVTTDQPANFQARILVFGASQIFGQEVPDAMTIPSQLQRLANQRFPGRYRVENRGVVAVNAYQQLLALQRTRLRPGDIVLFCDGDNDIYHGILNHNVLGYSEDDQSAVFHQTTWLDRLVAAARTDLPGLALPRLFDRIRAIRPPDYLQRAAPRTALAAVTSAVYGWNEYQAARLVAAAHGRFFHFLMPVLFDYPTQTAYRRSLMANPKLFPPGYPLAAQAARPFLARVMATLARLGITTDDLAPGFVRATAQQEVFLDPAHFNQDGAAAIAQELLQALTRDRFRDPAEPADPATAAAAFGRQPSPTTQPLPELPPSAPIRRRDRFYQVPGGMIAVPRELGHVWWSGIDVTALPGVVTAPTATALAARLTAATGTRQ